MVRRQPADRDPAARTSIPTSATARSRAIELGRTYTGKQTVRPTPNPNFRRVDAQIVDDNGNPIVTLSTIVGRPTVGG